jgi:hypothetical protein
MKLPKNPVNGLYFGKWTCGADKTDAVPCENMAAIAIKSVINLKITPMNGMQIWWKWKQWREQFPLDVYAEANITIKSVKEGQIPDFSLRFCPNWTAGNKSGRPKKGEYHKSGLEKVMAKGKPGVKRTPETKRRRCIVCGKFGHDSEGCWLLEKGDNPQPVVVDTLPIAEGIEDKEKGDKGKEGLV